MSKVRSQLTRVMLLSAFVMGMLFCFYPPLTCDAALVTDPAGDAHSGSRFTDFWALKTWETGTDLIFGLGFVDISQGLFGALLLDTDGNRQTHGVSPDHLTEATIEFNVAILGICNAQFFDKYNRGVYLNCKVSGNALYIALPKTLLREGTHDLEVAGIASTDFLCGGRDRIPDEGYMNVTAGDIHIDNEGVVLTPLSLLTDPADDSAAPADLRGMEVKVEGEHLVIRTHYHHSLEPHDISEVSVGMVSIDLDGDILTGFQNAGGTFPTFGVDTLVKYFIYPWALGGNIEVNLVIQEPGGSSETTNTQVGKYSSDSCFRRKDNVVEISIPLGLLPEGTNGATMLIGAFSPLTVYYDRFPDNGGVRLTDGSVKPFNACQSEEVFITDPVGDSFAFGYDNDDLTELRACHCEEGTLLAVGYSEFTMFGEAMTSVHLDLDQDASTGEQTFNGAGDTLMGIENTLVYQSGGDNDITSLNAIAVEGSSGDFIRDIRALITLNFYGGKAYITIPYRLFEDEGSMDVHAWTMSSAFGVPSFDDEIPNSGVFSIEAQ